MTSVEEGGEKEPSPDPSPPLPIADEAQVQPAAAAAEPSSQLQTASHGQVGDEPSAQAAPVVRTSVEEGGEGEPSSDPSLPPPVPPSIAETQGQPAAAVEPPQQSQTTSQGQVDNEPSALAPRNNGVQSTPLPWYKKFQGPLILLLVFIVVAVAAVITTVLAGNQTSSDDNGGNANEALDAPLQPGPSPVDPTLSGAPTSQPISKSETLNLPSTSPSSVTSPSPSQSTPQSATIIQIMTPPPSAATGIIKDQQPISARFKATIAKLTPLSGDALKVQDSPQYMAAKWIAEQDPILNPSTGGVGLGMDDPRLEQRYIMALFYYAMDGYNWKQNQGWLGGESECEWFGIDGASVGCGGEGRGGCIKQSDMVGDYDKICRIGMGK